MTSALPPAGAPSSGWASAGPARLDDPPGLPLQREMPDGAPAHHGLHRGGGGRSLIARAREPERLALTGILALAAVLYLWGLDRNGFGNAFYAAAVRSMTQNWHNFFYGAFDPGGFITVDKPPLSFWVQAASVKAFGFTSWSLLVPQALEGVASVYVLYRVVKAQAGSLAGLIAALALTLSPITVAINRDNNPDPTMVLMLLLAAWAVQSAISTGKFRKLALGGVFIGLAFTAKMLEAYVAVPGLALAFAFAGAVAWRRRIVHLLGGGVVMVAATWAWMGIVDLVPKADRPYVGGSTNDTVTNLVFGYNGLGRVNGNENRGGFGGGRPTAAAGEAARGAAREVTGRAGGGGGFGGGGAGFGRMFSSSVGGQIGWLIPFATLSLVAGLVLAGRRPRTDPVRAGLVMWGGWGISCWAVFSYSKGIFHTYYTSELAPALAALTGIGLATMISLARRRSPWAGLLAVGAVGTAVVEYILLDRTPHWNAWLRPTVIALAVIAAVAVVALLLRRLAAGRAGRIAAVAGIAGLAAILVGPAAYAVTPVTRSVGGSDPQAGPTSGRGGFGGGGRGGTLSAAQLAKFRQGFGGQATGGGQGFGGQGFGGQGVRGGTGTGQARGSRRGDVGAGNAATVGGFAGAFGGGRGGQLSTAMLTYLERNQGKATYLVAVSGDMVAEQPIIDTGKAILPMGGFSGGDPAPTLAQLKALVASGKLRYVLGGGAGGFGGGGRGGGTLASQRTSWIEQNCKVVNPAAYGGTSTAAPATRTAGTTAATASLYDCAGVTT
jgi:4-amino-4-deoxy-L-arabinose transferase-like glycosyltransferase